MNWHYDGWNAADLTVYGLAALAAGFLFGAWLL